MLEAVRKNLKGTLVVVVIVIFIVPMVIGGVGSSFLGSAAGTDALSVNGESVSELELERMIQSRRARLLAQGNIDASSPLLSDENLRSAVSDSLASRLALVTAGKDAGMAISDAEYQSVVLEQEQFQTDGKFDQQKFRYSLSQAGFTPATYRRDLSGDLIVGQQTEGLGQSAFVTEAEFAQLIKTTHQKRSFFAIKIPASDIESVEVSDAELEAYYQEHQNEYTVPEKLKIEYLDLTLDWLAQSVDVTEQDILDQYALETANFTEEASYEIAHIYFEKPVDSAKVEEVITRLQQGDDFGELAKTYSDDVGSADSGGELGVLTKGMFPDAFESAVYELEEGEVSPLVTTDDGAHIIRAVAKTTGEKPSFEERKAGIKSDLARALAQEEFATMMDRLGEFTFSAEDLALASAELGLPISESSYFDSRSGLGIAAQAAVRSAAFSEEIKATGNNSNVIELSSERAVVIRVKDIKASYVQELDAVKSLVEARVRLDKASNALKAQANSLEQSIASGASAEQLAESKSLEYSYYDLVKRSDINVSRELLGIAFAVNTAELETAKIVFSSQSSQDGGLWLMGVNALEAGELSDLRPEEKRGLMAQLFDNQGTLDVSTYGAYVRESAEIEIH